MDDLIAFLTARLDDQVRLLEDCAEPFLHNDRTGLDGLHPMILRYLRANSPAVRKIEVDAKREIIASATHAWEDRNGGNEYADYWGIWRDVIATLALPYAGHPDYRKEWKP